MAAGTKPYQEHAEKILDRICVLAKKGTKAETDRKKAFEERNSIEVERDEAPPDSPEYQEICVRLVHVLDKIEKIAIDIKFYDGKIRTIANNCEQGEFDFLEEPIKVPESLYDKLKPKKKDAEMKDAPDPDQQTLPMPNLATGEGVAEHMKAAITELELDKKDEARLIDAGFETIGALARFVDDENNSLGEKLNCGEGITSRIFRSLKSFRRAQTKAELAKERGE